MPENTVKVTRPSKWGNQFRVGIDGDAWECVKCYRASIGGLLRIKIVQELRGKNLACWCALDSPCHADVLLQIANEERKA
jgi:hypothetical protein